MIILFITQEAVGRLRKWSAAVNGRAALRCWLVIFGIVLLFLAHLTAQVIDCGNILDYDSLNLPTAGIRSLVPLPERGSPRSHRRRHGTSFGQLFQGCVADRPVRPVRGPAVVALSPRARHPLLVPKVSEHLDFHAAMASETFTREGSPV